MKLVILDRDGVINIESEAFIKSADEWEPIPGSLEAIATLNRAGYQVVVVTNQSGLARGLFNIEALHAIHEKMHNAVIHAGGHIDAVFYCPHGPDDQCSCRKPKPGLLLEIAQRLNISLKGVPFVGDSLRDLQAAVAAKAMPVLVRSGKGQATLDKGLSDDVYGLDMSVYKDLAEFAEAWVNTHA